MLESCGHTSETVNNLPDALDRIRNSIKENIQPDVIIMDLGILKGNGKEAADKIHSVNPKAKIVVTSGNTEDAAMVNYREFGFSGKLPKPFQIEDLKRVIYS